MSGDDSGSAHLRLGLQCRDVRRFDEAERHFKEAVGEDPRNDTALHLLGTAIFSQNNRNAEALQAVERAIAIAPNDAAHHALRAFILNALERPREALEAARTARALDPYEQDALIAEAQAHIQTQAWVKAERAAREALAIDADSSPAANLLAVALRMQNKRAENDAQIAGLLARDPEDDYTHYNAGWSALDRGDHRSAETHFREALRLNPEFEEARDGLLTSFRARSRPYRAYLWYSMKMARLPAGARWAVVIGIYFIYRLARTAAGTISPGLAIAVAALYLLFVFWSFIANPVGNLMLLWDRFARYALRSDEKIEAAAAGGGVVVGLLLLLVGLALSSTALMISGGALIGSSIPLSLVFTNKARAGSILFASIAAALLLSAAAAVVALAAGNDRWFQTAVLCLSFSGIAVFASTWLANVNALVRR